MTDTKPKCLICNHNHNPDEEHTWFGGSVDFEVSGEVKVDPEPVKKVDTTKEPRGPKKTRSEWTMNWRKKNPEKYREYMRNYMQKWRAAKE